MSNNNNNINNNNNSFDDDDEIQSASFDSFFQPHINIIKEFLHDFHATESNNTFIIEIPSNVIPSCIQMTCGFNISSILVEVSLTFQEMNWNTPLSMFNANHPIYKQNYIGKNLVYHTIMNFFSDSYEPKNEYRSASLLFNKHQFHQIKYRKYQVIFLILEILDSFIDIQDHCCICHQKLPYRVIKPSICNNQFCECNFSVAHAIRQDPRTADLLLTLFAISTMNPKYMNPRPSEEIICSMYDVFENLPSMMSIARKCINDDDIMKMCGKESLDLLRWVILSNKAQLIHLPEKLKIKNVNFLDQFMTLNASPKHEEMFKKSEFNISKKKKKNIMKHLREFNTEQTVDQLFNHINTQFLWHGSSADRWHSIFRNGLMNMSNKDCVHGCSHGPGIYLAKSFWTSIGYVVPMENLYKNSELGSMLGFIALCEVLKCKGLYDFGSFATLQDESAIIVRFIFPVNFETNVYTQEFLKMNYAFGEVHKRDIPTFDDVLNHLENLDSNKSNMDD